MITLMMSSINHGRIELRKVKKMGLMGSAATEIRTLNLIKGLEKIRPSRMSKRRK